MKLHFSIFLMIMGLFFCKDTEAQLVQLQSSRYAKHTGSVRLSAGGEGLFGSVEMELRLFGRSYEGLGIRVGVGFYTEDAFYLTIPVHLSEQLTLTPNRRYLELGFGVTYAAYHAHFFHNYYLYGDALMPPWNIIPSISYRQYEQKIYWFIQFSPVFNAAATTPWGGVGLGKQLF